MRCSIDTGKHAIVHDVRPCCLGTEFIGVPEYVSDFGVVTDKDLAFRPRLHIKSIESPARLTNALI